MHELSLAMAVVEQISEIAVKENVRVVKSLTLRIGKLAGVEREAFSFCFPLAAKGTVLEDANLVIEEEPIVLFCEECSMQTQVVELCLRCCYCGGDNVQMRSGRELRISSMEVD